MSIVYRITPADHRSTFDKRTRETRESNDRQLSRPSHLQLVASEKSIDLVSERLDAIITPTSNESRAEQHAR